ncbi:hypothetical protein JCM11641_000164 [Rhodosporidiobolus odoratus]
MPADPQALFGAPPRHRQYMADDEDRSRTRRERRRKGEERYLSEGKRKRRHVQHEDEGSSTSDDSDEDSSETSSDGDARSRGRRRAEQARKGGGLDWKIELVAVILGLYVYSHHNTASPSSSSGSADSDEATAAAPATSEGHGSSTEASAAAKTPTPTATSGAAGKEGSASLSASKSSGTKASASEHAAASDASGSASNTKGNSGSPATGAPDGFTGITLAGSWAETAAYTVATGDAADVPGPSSTVALDGLKTSANAAEATKGLLYIGDTTWYAAGSGGYGSCGEMLYDGQEPYFAAMSLYHWMGSPGPSPHCWECVQLQSKSDPSKVITAIVADSCEACVFAHIDLEQAAYYALGGTVSGGVLTVAWEFTDCPDGHSQKAIKALDSNQPPTP